MKIPVTLLDESTLQDVIKEVTESNTKQIALCKLGTLIKLFAINRILEYENNRSGELDESRCERMAENFNVNALGAVTASIHKNGSCLMLIDWHHRRNMLLSLHELAELSDSVLNSLITVTIVPKKDAIATYQAINAAKGHTGKEKINNADLAIGAIVAEIKSMAHADLPSKGTQNFMDCVMAFENKGSDFTLHDIYKVRAQITALLDTAKDLRSFNVEQRTKTKAAGALRQYNSVLEQVARTENLPAEVKKITHSPGFQIAFIGDYMSDGKLFGFSKTHPVGIVGRILKKLTAFDTACKLIARRNSKEIQQKIDQNATNIYKVFAA